MNDVLHPHIQDHFHVLIVQRVVDCLAVPARLDKSGSLERAELMGDRTLRHIKFPGDLVDAAFLLRKRAQDADPGPVLEYLVQVTEFSVHFF